MKRRQQERIARVEAAGRLRHVADMIESGNVRVADAAANVPDDVEYELEMEDEEQEGRLAIEIHWKG